jgi:apolipoprotein N-acyltransferase
MLFTLIGNLCALAAGAALPLAFAPFNYYFVAVAALLVLLAFWQNASPKLAFLRGLLFGIGYFGVGVSWVFISVHNYGNAPAFIAVLITAALVLFLALYPAFQGLLLNRIYHANNCSKLLLAFPASWVVFEWVRSWFLTGFPWLILGDSQIDSPLRGYAPLIGSLGISFLTAFTAAAIVALFVTKNNLKRIIIALLAIAIWVGGFFLAQIDWVKPIGKPFKVSLIQGNIAIERKWDSSQLLPILKVYTDRTKNNWDSKIIVWPETAIPTYPDSVAIYLSQLSFEAKLHNATVVTGAPIYNALTDRYYNGILAFGHNHGRYLKRRLVPFGEYLPLKSLLGWLHNYLTIPMSGFSRGPRHQPPLMANGLFVAPFICYEIIYSSLVLSYLPHAKLLITICDDSWFGRSIAADQHLEIARMRSLEVGRYQLLSTNTGISAIIDQYGKVIADGPQFKEHVLTGEIQGMRGSTPLVAFGRYFLIFSMLVLLWVASLWRHKGVTTAR